MKAVHWHRWFLNTWSCTLHHQWLSAAASLPGRAAGFWLPWWGAWWWSPGPSTCWQPPSAFCYTQEGQSDSFLYKHELTHWWIVAWIVGLFWFWTEHRTKDDKKLPKYQYLPAENSLVLDIITIVHETFYPWSECHRRVYNIPKWPAGPKEKFKTFRNKTKGIIAEEIPF